MKKYILNISWLLTMVVIYTSCESFLEEEPKTFLSPDSYFQSEAQVKAAVNGVYTFLDDRFSGDIGPGTQTYLLLEYMHGYGDKAASTGNIDFNQAITLSIAEDNLYVEKMWETAYKAIENCNSIMEGMESVTTEIMNVEAKNKLMGEVYFLRAYNYFNLVRLFGDLPLKLSSTKDLSNTQIELSTVEEVYTQIEKDLLTADSLMANSPWTSVEGRVSKGAVKALLSKVYLTMAGYPLQKGVEYYEKAYNQARAVVESEQFYLFEDYAALRDVANENIGEYIWMIQRHGQHAGSPVHVNMLPYPQPDPPISANGSFGGALAPAVSFYESYTDGDLRIEEKAYYYTEHETLNNPDQIVALGRPYIYKFWDQAAAESGQSGRNYSLIRFADVLLVLAEAGAQRDGGSTSDPLAIDAYYAVRSRALPDEVKPTAIATDDVLKERFWELAFEGKTWFTMLRTRKAFNTITGNMVNMIGFIAPSHPEGIAFEEENLLFPYPLREKRLNPNLKRD